ncbi:twin-arginine translocation signal domain-containing protein [Salinarimonas rosea]|uniref:twin-arginine translocation signal domain-containing protein n=1 Tax=Salinarimonas rosea TaxID=552063 RepID=UPI000428C6C2|nr:twin-arginine translocation signal domain-containing protein [Salinarimonas rosea]
MARRDAIDDGAARAAPKRRDLLKGLALAPAAAAGAVLDGGAPAQALTAPIENREPRYRETEHVLTYYRTNAR